MLLLAASYYFYMSWNAGLVFLIAGTTLISYGAGIAIEKSESREIKRLFLVLTIMICIGVLFFFKYFVGYLIGREYHLFIFCVFKEVFFV